MTTTAWGLVALTVVGAAALLFAGVVAAREQAARPGRRARGVAPLVPWIGTLLVVVLLVRGAVVGAVVVAAAVVAHAALTRWRVTHRP